MAEIGALCADVVSEKKKAKDSTFLSVRREAKELKAACDKGDVDEMLRLVRSFGCENNGSDLVARLEAARAREAESRDKKAEPSIETTVSVEPSQVGQPPMTAPLAAAHQKRTGYAGYPQAAPDLPAPDLIGEPGELEAVKPRHEGNPAEELQPSLPGCENFLSEGTAISSAPVTAVTLNGTEPKCFKVAINKLSPHPRVKDVFPIDDREFEALKANMSEIGFDPRRPVVAVADGKGGYLVVDGLSRLRAAQELGITEVYVMLVEFPNDEELDYFIATTQLLRRECTDPVLLTVAAIIIPVEERKAREERQGARTDLPATSTHKKAEVAMSTSDAVGLILHRSGSTVDKIKKVLANPEYIRKVKEDGIKISAAYRKIMAVEKPKPTKPAEEAAAAQGAGNGLEAPKAAGKTGDGDMPEESGNNDAGDVEDKLNVSEALLTALVDFVPEAQFAKIRSLFTGCSSQAVEIIEHCLDRRAPEPKEKQARKKSTPPTKLG